MVLDDKYVCLCLDHYQGQHCEKRRSEFNPSGLSNTSRPTGHQRQFDGELI